MTSDFVTLRDYIDCRFDEMEKQLNIREEAHHRAIAAAEQSIVYRLEQMNEFRGQLTDQAGTFVTRNEVLQMREATAAKISWLERIVYMGLGGLALAQVVITVGVGLWTKGGP